MKISIIVPVYNVELYLRKCVKSILAQTFKDKEIILVDDGSTDGSADICDELSTRYSSVKVIHKKNGGLSSARNVGLDNAKGDFVAFVDSDDTISIRMYDELYEGMILNHADVGICGRYYVYEDGTKLKRYKESSSNKVLTSEEAILEMNSFKSFDMAAWDKLYNRKIFDGLRFPEGKLSEDFFIMYKIFDRASKIFYTPKPLYNYLQRENSISHGKNINYDFIEAAKEQMNYVESKYPNLKGVVHTAYASAHMTVYDFHLKAKVPIEQKIRKSFQKNVKKNLKYINSNENIGFKKKVQAYLFVYNIYIYMLVFKFYKKVDRV